ncbi:hypothetical protein [Streptomyces chrestomyceticus]|uniref:hypothetical protein n=1 Tax=Streptomyces chrestomyceticus TaxID=68185 RepID=UPI0033F73A2E
MGFRDSELLLAIVALVGCTFTFENCQATVKELSARGVTTWPGWSPTLPYGRDALQEVVIALLRGG